MKPFTGLQAVVDDISRASISLMCIRSTISGKASEKIDFKVAETMKNVNLHVDPDCYIQPGGDGGKGCGSAYLFENSRKELLQKHREFYKSTLFKKHPLGLLV